MLYTINIMSAEEVLRQGERSASSNFGKEAQIVSNVVGKIQGDKPRNNKSFGALGLVLLMIIIVAIFFSSGNFIPAAISERLVEATDVQYADAVESKFLVFQQALENGDIPSNTIKRLESQGIRVNGNTLDFDGETITAQDFINKIHSNVKLYNAFNLATYGRAAYYYDESAEQVFKKLGTSRDNYSVSSDFDEVMTKLVGKGSDVNINNVGLVEKASENGTKYTEYEAVGKKASSHDSAEDFVKTVSENNLDNNELLATMDTATALNTADTISKEQKSSIFFMAFMENISKMKAGEGNDSKINEVMNYLFKEQESSVVDVNTGEVIETKGSMLEAPSLYAVLSGEKIDTSKVSNYASDRVLKTIENQAGVAGVSKEVRDNTITSTNTKARGTIGRYLFGGIAKSNYDTVSSVVPTINSSMVENDFSTISGIYGGEMLVEGAVNVGKMLAKGSGATPGDANSVKSYARLNSTILALDTEADRMNRSPFDMSSKNTFLGSIIHSIAIGLNKNLSTSIFNSIGDTIGAALGKLSPTTYADDNANAYLNNFGNCETINSIGAVGSAACSEVATFDTSTLNDTFNNSEFIAFVEENTNLENGKRTIKKDSLLADFIKYNNERITPIGIMDGGILEAIKNKSTSLSFISDIISMVRAWLGASSEDKTIATGEAFVNSTTNPNWNKYKYAQRYVSLARATEALRQYDGDETAYNSLPLFEGTENPVIAFLNDYYSEIATNH